MIGFVARRLMELETEARCGAAHGELNPERQVQRNGHRQPAAPGRPDWTANAAQECHSYTIPRNTTKLDFGHPRSRAGQKAGRRRRWYGDRPCGMFLAE